MIRGGSIVVASRELDSELLQKRHDTIAVVDCDLLVTSVENYKKIFTSHKFWQHMKGKKLLIASRFPLSLTSEFYDLHFIPYSASILSCQVMSSDLLTTLNELSSYSFDVCLVGLGQISSIVAHALSKRTMTMCLDVEDFLDCIVPKEFRMLNQDESFIYMHDTDEEQNGKSITYEDGC